MFKNRKGITLIALIVSIIVLLILAGVTISVITGENGIITQAGKAKEETKIAAAKEKIDIEVQNSYMTSGKKEYENLKNGLQDLKVSNLPSKEKYPVYLNVDGYDFKIDKDWNVSKADNIVYHASNLKFDGNKDYIDTGIKLFSEENFNKDFQIRIIISEFGNYKDWATILSALKEDESLNYPGFNVRRRTNNKTVQLGFGSGKNIATNLESYVDRAFVITRINGSIYYGFEDDGLTYVKDVSSLPFFDTPVTLGAALDGNGTPWRYFEGEISDIQIVLGERGIDITKVYAKLYDDNTLVFSNNDETIQGRTLTKTYEDPNLGMIEYTKNNDSIFNTPWCGDNDVITKVEFADEITPLNIKGWFAGLTNLTEIKNMENLKIIYVADVSCAFLNCQSIETIDFSSWDTSRVMYMNSMLNGCTNLKSVDLENFTGDSVRSLSNMCRSCNHITNVNMKKFIAANCESSNEVFLWCYRLQTVDLSSWSLKSLKDIKYMFNQCTSLKEIKFNNADFSEVNYWSWAFYMTPSDIKIHVKDENQKNYIMQNVTNSNNGKTLTDENFIYN